MATGQLTPKLDPGLIEKLATAALQGLIPPNAVYIKVSSPVGSASVDPFAAAQDPATQAILQRLGVTVTLGFGPPPAPVPGEASLFENLSTGLLVGGVVLAYALRPQLSTLLVIGGVYVALQSGILQGILQKFTPAPA